MKKIILSICLVILCTSISIGKPQQEVKQDTTSFVKKSLYNATEALNKRDFSKDVEKLKIKTDSLVKEYTPEVKGFINSLGEYFKR